MSCCKTDQGACGRHGMGLVYSDIFDSSVWMLSIFYVKMVYLDYMFSACHWCDGVAGNKQRRKQTKHRPRVTTTHIARETFLLKKLCIKQT